MDAVLKVAAVDAVVVVTKFVASSAKDSTLGTGSSKNFLFLGV